MFDWDNPWNWMALACIIFLSIGVWIGRLAVRTRHTRQDEIDAYWLDCMHFINELREYEGWEVKLICDNPDFDSSSPDCCVTVFGEWMCDTNPPTWTWRDVEFRGGLLLQCLAMANAECKVQRARQISLAAGV